MVRDGREWARVDLQHQRRFAAGTSAYGKTIGMNRRTREKNIPCRTHFAELKPRESKSVDIKYSPAAAGTFAGVLTVTGNNLSAAAKLPLSGQA